MHTCLATITPFTCIRATLEKKPGKQVTYEKKLYAMIARVLGTRQRITPKSKLVNLGMDSLARVQLLSTLEEDFDIILEETQLTEKTTIVELEKNDGS